MSVAARIIIPAMTFLGVLTACSEQNFSTLPVVPDAPRPDIEVSPLELTYGTVRDGGEEVQSFIVENVGEGVLTVENIKVEGSVSFTVLSETSFTLTTGERREIAVAFAPMAANENFAQVVVFSDDPVDPAVPVDVIGFGAVPELTITPAPFDFGQAFLGCPESVLVMLENTGTDALTIDGLNYLTDGQMTAHTGGLEFPVVLEPGQHAQVSVSYFATRVGQAAGELEVYSDDPRRTVTAAQSGEGVYAAFTTERFVVPPDAPVDILVAIDQSCSMDNDAVRLASNFSTFINTLQTVTNGWQIGVSTLESGCFNSGVLTANTPNYTALFSNGVTLGGHHIWTEALLKLADVSLSKVGPTGCNAGFLRPGAMLHVILVSDEPYQGPGTPAQFVGDWIALKGGDPSLVKVSSVVDMSNCEGLGNSGYVAATNLTGGLLIDICDSNWAVNHTAALAQASLSAMANFDLQGTVDPSTITVLVNGQPATGWVFNPATNQVQFFQAHGANTEIDISYGVLPTCN